MFCGKCGQEVPNEAKFCSKCGSPVSVVDWNSTKKNVSVNRKGKKLFLLILVCLLAVLLIYGLVIGGGILNKSDIKEMAGEWNVTNLIQEDEDFNNATFMFQKPDEKDGNAGYMELRLPSSTYYPFNTGYYKVDDSLKTVECTLYVDGSEEELLFQYDFVDKDHLNFYIDEADDFIMKLERTK